jgi:8-oxo-dGTP pyrophosphatase MutT (NUDIX family)
VAISDYIRGLRERIGTELLLQPSVASLIRDGDGRILLVRHFEGRWMLPGGTVDPGERPADAARRECWEEAGVLVEPVRVAGVFGGPEYRITYGNGDESAWVTAIFEARVLAGEPHPHDDETIDTGWYAPEELEALDLAPSMRRTLGALLAGTSFDEATWTP